MVEVPANVIVLVAVPEIVNGVPDPSIKVPVCAPVAIERVETLLVPFVVVTVPAIDTVPLPILKTPLPSFEAELELLLVMVKPPETVKFAIVEVSVCVKVPVPEVVLLPTAKEALVKVPVPEMVAALLVVELFKVTAPVIANVPLMASSGDAPEKVRALPLELPVKVAIPLAFETVMVPVFAMEPILWFAVLPMVTPPEPVVVLPLFTKFPFKVSR